MREIGDGIQIDDDPERVDVDELHRFLTEEAYWVPGRSRETIERLVWESTHVIGAYDGDRLVGFARVVSDRSNFAWLGDVFVVESHRGRGIGTELVRQAVENEPERDLVWYLSTRDARSLYERFGFVAADPERVMTRPRAPDA
jgi:GNAT superfamily N-acetyltransferase